jgi:hypothetical protein
MHPVLGFAPIALALCSACQGESRPAYASDGYEPAPSEETAETDPVLVDDEREDVARFCGETSVELPIVRPTFYFILDSSGSMEEPMPKSGGKTRHWAARQAIAQTLNAVGQRVNFGAATFPTRDTDPECAPGEEVFEVRAGDPVSRVDEAGAYGPVLSSLMFTLRKRGPSGATPTSATLRALRPTLEELGPKTSVFLLTDGAPNCGQLSSCESQRCMGDIERLSLTNGMICGVDIACCAADLFPWLCLDSAESSAELQALADAGIKTYVIGLPGTEAYAEVLGEMAQAGGTARAGEGEAYYRVDDVDELALTLDSLGTELSLDCHIQLDQVPKRRDRIAVIADGTLLEGESADGWIWTSETEPEIELQGESCRLWRAGEWDQLHIVEGCEFRVR